MLYQESGDGSTTPVLKSIVGLNSPISIDQCVFQASLLARIVQILLTTSPDLPSEGITKAYFLWSASHKADGPATWLFYHNNVLWARLLNTGLQDPSENHFMRASCLNSIVIVIGFF